MTPGVPSARIAHAGPARPGRLAALLGRIDDRSGRSAQAGLALLLAGAAVVIYRKGLGTTFYLDDWAWFINRRDWSVDALLQPESGHLDAVPIFVYKVFFSAVGLEHYGVYRAALIANHLLCVALVFALVRRRVGDGLALAACVPVALLGSGWQNILLPIQLSFLIPIAGGLGAWLLLERRTRAADAAACLLLVLAIGELCGRVRIRGGGAGGAGGGSAIPFADVGRHRAARTVRRLVFRSRRRAANRARL